MIPHRSRCSATTRAAALYGVKSPGSTLRGRSFSRLPQRLLDVLFEFVSRDRAVSFLHGVNIAAVRIANNPEEVR